MTEKLRNLDLENLLFFDAEFVRAFETLEKDSKEFEMFQYKNRNKETGELPTYEETIELYKKNGGLNPAHNKVVTISVGAFIKGKKYIKSFTGTQKEILEQFIGMMNSDTNKSKIYVGFNVVLFDFPQLRLKAVQEGLHNQIPERLSDAGKKEWSFTEFNRKTNVVDLMIELKGTGYSPMSLEEACYITGVDSPKDDIAGHQVSDVYYSEGVERIKTYCEKDVNAVMDMFLKLVGQDVEQEEKEVPEAIDILLKVYRSGDFSGNLQERMRKHLDKVKLTKEDKKNLFTIFRGSWVYTDFINNNQDSKKVIKEKEEIIKEFIESL